MATAKALSDVDDCEFCAFCSTKYDRIRPSLCQCKHCSTPFCVDCIKEHHEELFKEVTILSHEYNELKELLQTKRMFVTDETTKSIEDVNQFFQRYISELTEIQEQMIADIEETKQNAQIYLTKIDSDLSILGIEIQSLVKQNIAQITKTQNLSIKIKSIQQTINTYQLVKVENLVKAKPEFSITFQCAPGSSTNDCSGILPEKAANVVPIEIAETPFKESASIFGTQVTSTIRKEAKSTIRKEAKSTIRKEATNTIRKEATSTIRKEATSTIPNEATSTFVTQSNKTVLRSSHLKTHQSTSRWMPVDQKEEFEDPNEDDYRDDDDNGNDINKTAKFNIDRMASDGKNIMYTSYFDDEPDIIAFVHPADIYRDWHQNRIKDMIWWKTISKFICATHKAIYTVEYVRNRFKIVSVIHGDWSFCRVASNTNYLFLWMHSNQNGFHGFEIFSDQFQCIRNIDFKSKDMGSFSGESTSFCITDQMVASLCNRRKDNLPVVQITLCDLEMNKLYSIPLGRYDGDVEIRTNGKNQFFVTTGSRRLFIVDSDGKKRTINLKNYGELIAVLDNKRLAISKCRKTVEIVNY